MVSVVLYGTLLGGIVYAHLVFFPPYLSGLPNSAVLVNGAYPLHDEKFWTLIHPLAVLSLIIALAFNWKIVACRRLIMIPLAIYVLALVVTAWYFVPELRAFRNSPNLGGSPAEWFARGQRWQYLSWLRGAMMYLGMAPLLLALITPDENSVKR